MEETPQDIADVRRDYLSRRLRRGDLHADPVAQFSLWLKDAFRAGVIEPNAMSLATARKDGRPSVRTVLLKGVDERGFIFFTNLESRKARQLAENTNVAAFLGSRSSAGHRHRLCIEASPLKCLTTSRHPRGSSRRGRLRRAADFLAQGPEWN